MNIENFDIIKYLESREIEYKTSGKNVTKNWIEINCPFCGNDPSFHCGISLQKLFNCYICGEKGDVTKLVRQIESCSWHKAKDIVVQFSEDLTVDLKKDNIRHIHKIDHLNLPKISLFLPCLIHKNYLIKRNFDPDYLTKKYKLRFCYNIGEWKFRIIIPFFLDNKLVTWTARDVSGKAEIKYKHLDNEKSIIPVKKMLYNIDSISEGDSIIIVEGITDVWRLGEPAIATMGIQYTQEQVEMILKKNPKKIIVLFDAEQKAITQANKLANQLSLFISDVSIIELDEGDPCDLSIDKIKEIKNMIERNILL